MGLARVVFRKGRSQIEVAVLLAILGYWYLTNLDGGIVHDVAIFAQSSWGMVGGYMYGNPTHAHAPLAKYFMAISQMAFGTTEFGVKLPGVVFALGTVYVTYSLGRLLYTRTTGIVAASLLGISPSFTQWVVTGHLDVPLTFFVSLGMLLLLYWYRSPLDSKWTIVLGIVAICIAATKLQGAIFLFALLVAVAIRIYRSSEPIDVQVRSVKGVTVGLFAGFGGVYWPFLLSPHPNYYGGYAIPTIAEVLFGIPYFGNLIYAFAESFVHNFGHIDSGHYITIAGTTYQYAPWWTYLYWLVKYGDVLVLLGLAVLCVGIVRTIRQRNVRVLPDSITPTVPVWLGLLVLIPFVAISLISVKGFRYILPLYPALLVIASELVYLIWRERISEGISFSPQSVVHLLVLGTILIATTGGLAAHSPMDLQRSSGYGEATQFVEQYASSQDTTGPIHVAARAPLPMHWYLGDTRLENYSIDADSVHRYDIDSDGGIDIVLQGIGYAEQPYLNHTTGRLENGTLCLVVDDSGAPVKNEHVWQEIRTTYEPVAQFKRTGTDSPLVVYKTSQEC